MMETIKAECYDCNSTGLYRGIHTVSRSRGNFVGTGVGAIGASISYNEFKTGKMP